MCTMTPGSTYTTATGGGGGGGSSDTGGHSTKSPYNNNSTSLFSFLHAMAVVHHIFQWDGGGKEVFLVGSFNGWEKVPVTLPNG